VSGLWPWLAVFGLGMFHGINPAMGWLFAVALGLQEQNRAAVFRALPPIVLGHALSIGIVIGAVLVARVNLSHRTLKISAAAVLFTFGLYRLLRARHPNWVGMRVGFGDLTVWSFIMASAHGAGLMLIPFFLGSTAPGSAHHHGLNDGTHQMHAWAFANFSAPSLLAGSVIVHTLGYLLTTAMIAIVVYENVGVAILRRAWFNIDLVWMLALMITGAFILLF
jgi:hypothetical protein